MLDGISDIARGVQACKPGDLVFSQMMEELRANCSPIRQHELLVNSLNHAATRQAVRRAVRLLRKASVASRQKKWDRTFAMVRLAFEAVERDKQLLRDLLKTHQLKLSIIPHNPVARDKQGLVDPRLTVIDEPRPRYGFAG